MNNSSSTAALMVSPETIGVTLDIVGGHRALSKLPYGYEGLCRVIDENNGNLLGIFPNTKEACSVARYAIFPDGGYGPEIIVIKADPSDVITHKTLEEWISN